MRLTRHLGTVVVCGAVVSACSAAPSPRAVESRIIGQEAAGLEWGDCDPDDQPLQGTVECATLQVPLDYDDPAGDTIELAIVRVPAGSDRVGAVLTNPGGPGGSGFDLVINAGSRFHAEMGMDDFDIVGFDPRGVDRSDGIECVSDEVLDEYLYIDPRPDTPEEERRLHESEDVFIEGCQREYGDDLIHYSTENTARDMDAIREALGDEQISYLGISYGTYLGAVYATMFPGRVRAMVLDSAYEPTGDTLDEQWLTQLEGFEGAFDNWAAWCAEDDACAFAASTPDAVGERWDAIYEELDDNSLVVDGRHVNQDTLMTATVSAMYSETSWPDLASALAEAEEGDMTGILRLADQYHQRRSDGTFASIRQAGPVIRCASGLTRDEPDDLQEMLDQLGELAPRFSRDYTIDTMRDICPDLIGESVEMPELGYEGDAPILVVGGENDPATPFRWAETLKEAMGQSAVLVSYTGEGHGYVFSSDCVTELEAAAIVDLELPPDGTVCEPDPLVEEPEWWDDIDTPAGVSDVEQLASVLAVFGLGPRDAYSEVRLTDMTTAEVHDGYAELLDDEGFDRMIGAVEILDHVEASYFTPPSGDLTLIVVTVPPEALETEELDPLVGAIPDGETAVVIAALEIF